MFAIVVVVHESIPSGVVIVALPIYKCERCLCIVPVAQLAARWFVEPMTEVGSNPVLGTFSLSWFYLLLGM